MTSQVLSKHRSHQQAQAARSHWIRMQKLWDRAFERARGYRPDPRPHEVYRVVKQGNHGKRRFYVVFDDPSM